MKKLFLVFILLLIQIGFAVEKPAKFEGNWALDFNRSKNLPNYYQNIKSHKLFITQNEKVLNVDVEINLGRNEPDKLNFNYQLDGTETKTETKIRTQNGTMVVPTTLKAVVKENGNVNITISREINLGDAPFKGVTTENWELSPDGKTLKIHRVDDTPRGKMEMDMVFVKE